MSGIKLQIFVVDFCLLRWLEFVKADSTRSGGLNDF